MGKNVAVVGLQWGDEGKGKIVDVLAQKVSYVVRYCGGANAGHTVVANDVKLKLHLLPCGLLADNAINVIGNGVVFDPEIFVEEISLVEGQGVKVTPDRLRISSASTMVMPWHKLLDRLSEQSLKKAQIGTTCRGIGPAYSDKAMRTTSMRVEDLLLPADELRQKIETIAEIKNRLVRAFFADSKEEIAVQDVVASMFRLREIIVPYIANTGAILRRACGEGSKSILFEGGQGALLDVDHGTYPFVTSSPVTACGIPSGAGVSPKSVGLVLGIVKAYCTRVGEGPFPTEIDDNIAKTIRDRGHEYGTTTGRPRRVGWLDLFALRYSCQLGGVDEMVIGLMDVLSGIGDLKVCVGYRKRGKDKDEEDFDASKIAMADVAPKYGVLEGWNVEIDSVRSVDQLPSQALDYLRFIESYTGVRVGFVGVGPDRSQLLPFHSELRL